MQRIGYMIKVKSDQVAQYIEEHKALPPELLADIQAAGIRNSSLWMGPDGLVFGYLECDDWQAVLDHMATSEANEAWQQRMHAYQEPPRGDEGESMWMRTLELICLTD